MPSPAPLITLALGLALALAGCAAPTPPPATAQPLTATLVPTAPPTRTAPLPTVAPTPTAAATFTPEAGIPLEAGQWNSLYYDPARSQVVLVNGGPDRGKPLTDPLELWVWDGAQWTLLSADPDGPHWRNFAGAAYDTTREVLVIHGGVQTRGAWLDDTWEWDGQTWTQVNASDPGPGPREGVEMAYDAAHGQVILFGGATTGGVIAGDTWAWNGQAWAQVSTTGPAPRFPNAMVYDAARAEVLLYGGHYVDDTAFHTYGDLWAWDGAAWRELLPDGPNPGYRIVSRLVYDPLDERVLMFGGSGGAEILTDMWAWDGAQWAQIATDGAPARSGLGGAYDPTRNVVVAFGGVAQAGGRALTTTWEWDRQAWQCQQGCP